MFGPDGTAGPNQLCLDLELGTNPEGICHRGEIKVQKSGTVCSPSQGGKEDMRVQLKSVF